MADGFSVRLALTGDLKRWERTNREAVLKGLKRGALEAADYGKRELRQALTQSGLKLNPKTWRAEVYPPGMKLTWEPVVFFYSKAPRIIAAFDQGGTISAKGGYMAVPLPYFQQMLGAKQRNQYSKSKVQLAYDMFGEENLIIIPAAGDRPAILALKSGGVTKTGRIRAAAQTKTGKHRKNKAMIPLFWLVSKVELQQRLNVEATFDKIERQAPGVFARALAGYLKDVK